MSKTRTLDDITTELGKAYKTWKSGEASKNKLKDEFFEVALAQHGDLEEKYVVVEAESESEARARAVQYYPTFAVDDLQPHEDEGKWEVILTELPKFKTFSHVNPDDGMLYRRQISAGPILLDDERLWKEKPDLWRQVMEIPNREMIRNVMYECNVDHTEIDEKLEELWDAYDGPRVLKDFESMDPDTLSAVQDYVYQGPPTIKFAPPKKAKPEDLE